MVIMQPLLDLTVQHLVKIRLQLEMEVQVPEQMEHPLGQIQLVKELILLRLVIQIGRWKNPQLH